tara:strand:+ start:446 stop:832 length:387 start_codon:yes stop_codon:yes gene_type:complete
MEKTIAQQLNIKEFPFEIIDKNGKMTYREFSDGCWWKYEYDYKGRITYCENDTGYWEKTEYDSKRNITYSEYSNGKWYKTGFNEKGDVIYLEDSKNGVTLDYRPKSKCEDKVIEIDGKKYKLTEIKVK